MPLQIRTTPTTRPKPAPKVPTTLAPARTGPSLQASQDRLRPASEVWLSGHGFSPGAVVTLSFHSVPTRLGQTTVGADGSFRVLVTVPGAASAGEHHFMADDVSTQGSVSAETAVFVFARSHNGIPLSTTLTMVGLALLIPVAAYLGMAAPGALRRRGTGSGPAT